MKLKAYLAAPLFNEAELRYNERVAEQLSEYCDFYLPQSFEVDSENGLDHQMIGTIFMKDVSEIQKADLLIAILDGVDVDSGTAWEVGYAHALGKTIIGLRTDFRIVGGEERCNLMVQESVKMCRSVEEVVGVLEGMVRS